MEPTAYRYVSTTETTTDDDLDLIAIERVINNSRPLPTLTPAEQRITAHLMHQDDVPIEEIAARVGVAKSTVSNWLNPGPKQPRQLKPCPSRAAYLRHRAAGEDCEPCRRANAAADARYRRTGTGRQPAA
ncbi:hypothetical protein [Kitasatospora sp. NPDC086791]|uniref:hypothetical protein n=1 Tax=Kitasatospora sp. NPDC086791 TaxID=3155178 RepID=UPI00342DF179